jgi:hypothetical protein
MYEHFANFINAFHAVYTFVSVRSLFDEKLFNNMSSFVSFSINYSLSFCSCRLSIINPHHLIVESTKSEF